MSYEPTSKEIEHIFNLAVNDAKKFAISPSDCKEAAELLMTGGAVKFAPFGQNPEDPESEVIELTMVGYIDGLMSALSIGHCWGEDGEIAAGSASVGEAVFILDHRLSDLHD